MNTVDTNSTKPAGSSHQKTMNLIYQAYGANYILRQTLFSLVSLFNVMPAAADRKAAFKVVVYTDQPTFFENYFGDAAVRLGLIIHEVSVDQIKKWRGAIDFVHRVKVEVLVDAAKHYPGRLFYVDGDTYFREDPTALFDQVNDENSLMHIAEYRLQDGRDPLAKKILKFVKRNQFEVQGEAVKITPEHSMYNAGAIGISANNTKWLPLVLELTDKMFMVYGKHVIEQLAFSYYLQSRSKVFVADHLIGHYWNQKDEFQTAIDAYLEKHKTYVEARTAYPQGFKWPEPPVHTAPRRSLGERISRLFGH